MGAYLSEPIRDKDSCDESADKLTYGASCMQGWRVSQEDAHNCCPNFDNETGTSLFAVYDGHGGAEVAQYTAMHFPGFVKKIDEYNEGKLALALERAFLGFDNHLTEEKVVQQLKELAGVNPDEDDVSSEGKGDGGKEEAATLYEEATMPLEQLLERYGYAPGTKKPPGLLQKLEKFQSPVIRAKKEDTSAANADSNEASSTKTTDDGVIMKLDSQLLNGHSENENNANLEKERADKLSKQQAQETVVDSTTKDNAIQTSKPVVEASNSEAEARDSSKDISTTSGTNGSPATDEKPSSSTPEPAGAGSSSGSNSSAEAGGSASEGPSSSGCAGGNSSKIEDAGPGPSSSKSDDCKPGSSSGNAADDDSEEDSEEEEWNSSDEEDMEDMPGSDDEDEEDDEGDDEEEDEIMTGGEEPGADSGCTAVVALLRGKDLYVANAGDSRCVVSREGKAVDMSVDHKPEDDLERNRIEKAGGRVTADGRVNGGLNLSRAIGDHCYKQNKELSDKEQMITALPDVRCITLDEKDDFMVLACDGIWNAMTSQDVVDFVSQRMSHGVEKLSTICEEMFEFCLAPDTSGDGTGCDNMTAIIVKFDKLFKTATAGSATKRPATEISKDSSEETLPDTKKAKSVSEDAEDVLHSKTENEKSEKETDSKPEAETKSDS